MGQTDVVKIYQYHYVQSDGTWRFTFSANPKLGNDWKRDGIAWYAHSEADTDLVPVYQYHYVQSDGGWRFTFSTNPKLGNDWKRDGIAWYGVTSTNSNSVPIYQYHAVQSDGGWRFTFSTNPKLGKGWTRDGVAFYGIPGGVPSPTPGLRELKDVRNFLRDSDEIKISASNHQYITIDDSDRLIAVASEENATRFNVEFRDSQLCLKTNGKYVKMNSDGCLYASANSINEAVLTGLEVSSCCTVLFPTGDKYWTLRSDGAIDLNIGAALGLTSEFNIHIKEQTMQAELHRLQILEAELISDCDRAMANLVWHITGGFFLALGLGPYIGNEKVQTGVLGLIKSNPTAWSAVQRVVNVVKSNPKLATGAVFSFLGILYTEDLLWSVVRMVLTSAGWWIALKAVAKILEVVLLPEAEAVELIASFVVWSAQLILKGENVADQCT